MKESASLVDVALLSLLLTGVLSFILRSKPARTIFFATHWIPLAVSVVMVCLETPTLSWLYKYGMVLPFLLGGIMVYVMAIGVDVIRTARRVGKPQLWNYVALGLAAAPIFVIWGAAELK